MLHKDFTQFTHVLEVIMKTSLQVAAKVVSCLFVQKTRTLYPSFLYLSFIMLLAAVISESKQLEQIFHVLL